MIHRQRFYPICFSSHFKGFTLIEVMIVIAIIGILAAIAIPNYLQNRQKAKIISLVGDLKAFEKGFMAYAADKGQFPDDSHIILPPGTGIEKYLPSDRWDTPLYVGGNFNWEGPDSYPYAGIAIFNTTAPESEIRLIDEYIDNGDLNSGKFRITPNGRYTYIIDE